MYVKYCENKPKSEYIVAEYIDYFEVIRGASTDIYWKMLTILFQSSLAFKLCYFSICICVI